MSYDKLEQQRQRLNRDLVKRMRNGESLTRMSADATHFPPRPTIKKDPKALTFLYEENSKLKVVKSITLPKERA